MSHHAFTLDIAGVVAEVTTPDATWAAPLIDRYAGFLSAASPVWRVAIAHAPELTETDTPWIRHEGPLTRYRLFSLAGVIDLDTRQAAVQAPTPAWAASGLERTLTYILMQTLPREYHGLLIHGAGIVLGQEPAGRRAGYLFTGPSGAGKTTIASLAQNVGEVLSDENVVVRVAPDGMAELCSTPFWGQSTPAEQVRRVNHCVPLRAIYMLKHAPNFELTPLRPAEAAAALLGTEKVATERVESAAAWLRVVDQLASTVPVYRLSFRPTTELWGFLTEAIASSAQQSAKS